MDLQNRRAIDQICSDFEDEWTPESIEDWRNVKEHYEPEIYPALVKNLIEVDVELRLRSGLPDKFETYESLHPSGSDWASEYKHRLENDIIEQPTDVNETILNRLDDTVSLHLTTAPSIIGPYHLLEQIGQGGMGTVWKAKQTNPINRIVAIKVVRSGLDSKQVISRFEAERKALALMEHPNIARIVDAGKTESGQLYFAMEHVNGSPLTAHCKDKQLPVAVRLNLFIEICEAVHHAHQKGIIHRDLKPTNILIAEIDDRATPKVIDFGLAKAFGTQLDYSQQTQNTSVGQVLGTLNYMSPEQASLSADGIDTRTDVYALGTILYELLTDATPLEEEFTDGQSVFSILELIRNRQPQRPSRKLGSLLNYSESVYSDRRTDSASLSRILRGDLDWIVMKAIEKEPNRRYQSASEFANDVRRFLNGEPVNARPASIRYLATKFVRKNRVASLVSCLLLASLIIGIVGTSYGMILAQRRATQEEKANQLATSRLDQVMQSNEILTSIFRDLNVYRRQNPDQPLEVTLADRLIKASNSLSYSVLGNELATADMERELARTIENLGFPKDAIPGFERAMATYEKLLQNNEVRRVGCGIDLAGCYLSNSNIPKAGEAFQKAVELCKDLPPDRYAQKVRAINGLANVRLRQNDFETAIPLLEEAFSFAAQLVPRNEHKFVFLIRRTLGDAYQSLGDRDTARTIYEKLIAEMLNNGTGSELELESCRFGLASCLMWQNEFETALPLLERVWADRKMRFGKSHAFTQRAGIKLGECYNEIGDFDAASRTLLDVIESSQERSLSNLLLAKQSLARVFADQRKFAAARNLLQQSLNQLQNVPEHSELYRLKNGITADLRRYRGKEDEK